jgi:TP901-1 family phage major tail protein
MKGTDFVLLVGDGAAGFDQVGALRGTGYSGTAEMLNVTSKDSVDGWRELLDGGGHKSLTITADGVWEATTEQKLLRTLFLAGTVRDMQIDDGDDVMEGGFQVTGFSVDGPDGAEQTYSVTLESADKPTFV